MNCCAGSAEAGKSLSSPGSVRKLPVILVIEDDEQIQSVVEDALIEAGFEPAIAASGEEAVTLLKSRSFIKERPRRIEHSSQT